MLTLSEISFSMEICSEAPGYLNDWPSDITILSTTRSWAPTSAREILETGGANTPPPPGPNGRTQYGLLKTFSITDSGGYIDKDLVNPNISIADLHLEHAPYISLKIQIKDDAKHIGGINLFGEKYGDYPQGIVMSLIY